jgi:cytochrome c553
MRHLPALVACALVAALLANACKSDTEADDSPKGSGGESAVGSGGVSEVGSGGASGGDVGESGGMGGDPGVDGSGGDAPAVGGYPSTLDRTGLYTAPTGEVLALGVHEFRPRFPLYTDDATKRRFVYLPPGTKIDTSDPDFWVFPTGAKLWKEFTRDGTRVETRYLERRKNGSFWRVAYQWNDAQTEAVAVPLGEQNASGTQHDIPSSEICSECHGRTPGEVLGFSQIQLGFDSELFDLADLVAGNLLTNPPASPVIALPGSQVDQDALGYLHSNCGTCHNASKALARVDMELRLMLDQLGTVGDTPVAKTAFGVMSSLPVEDGVPGATMRIVPGSADTSAAYLRMNSRGELYSMPPLGTELIHTAGSATLKSWIDGLPPPQ